MCFLTIIPLPLTIFTVPLLEEPLCQERESHLHLKDLWMTSLTSQHVLWSHIDRTSVTAAALTGTPPNRTSTLPAL